MKTGFLTVLCIVLLVSGASAGAKKSRKKKACVSLADALGDFGTLVAALEATDLTGAVTAEDASLTVFAPTNEAFAAAVEALGTTLEDLVGQTELLAGILKYHVLGEAKTAKKLLKKGEFATLLSEEESSCGVNTLSLKASKKAVTVEGGFTSAKVVKANVVTCESTIIHVIDAVLLPCPVTPAEGMTSGSG